MMRYVDHDWFFTCSLGLMFQDELFCLAFPLGSGRCQAGLLQEAEEALWLKWELAGGQLSCGICSLRRFCGEMKVFLGRSQHGCLPAQAFAGGKKAEDAPKEGNQASRAS